MVRDALDGKIDLIVTKSISRFARNTVDSLVTIRKLKAAGVEFYFEKENIYTFDSKGELLITIMSSLAQEESRSISKSVTWGKRKQFSDGKVHVTSKNFLGYKKGANGKPEIIEHEAKIVREIYSKFMQGKTTSWIAKYLTKSKVKTPGGKDIWYKSTVDSILTNEKYKGDALLQKTFTVDFLDKKIKKNEGEVSQYYVENSHPAIIDPIVCEDCGGFYGQKVWHSNSKYRRVIWQCNDKINDKENKCKTPNLKVEEIQMMFLDAYNTFMGNREKVIEDCEMMRSVLVDFKKIDNQIVKQQEEVEMIAEYVRGIVKENASTPQSQDDYIKKYESLSKRYEEEYRKLENLLKDKELRISNDKTMEVFIENLKKQPLVVEEWDEALWSLMIEKAVVGRHGSIRFIFYNGMEVKAM